MIGTIAATRTLFFYQVLSPIASVQHVQSSPLLLAAAVGIKGGVPLGIHCSSLLHFIIHFQPANTPSLNLYRNQSYPRWSTMLLQLFKDHQCTLSPVLLRLTDRILQRRKPHGHLTLTQPHGRKYTYAFEPHSILFSHL